MTTIFIITYFSPASFRTRRISRGQGDLYTMRSVTATLLLCRFLYKYLTVFDDANECFGLLLMLFLPAAI